MYMYDDGNNELVAKSCAQLLVSYDFSQMIYIDGKSKIIIRIDKLGCAVVELNALSVEKI